MASARPYANNLHFSPDQPTPTPLRSIFTGQDALPAAQPCQNTESMRRHTTLCKLLRPLVGSSVCAYPEYNRPRSVVIRITCTQNIQRIVTRLTDKSQMFTLF